MIINSSKDSLDLVGVGIGPFNLSLAALLTSVTEINSIFFEQKTHFAWHPNLLFQDADIQVNYLKDLVTLVDPTNQYSFINYLAKNKRLYRFLNANFEQISRVEFNLYLAWVSKSLSNLFFKERVQDIKFSNQMFETHTSKGVFNSKHLVLGSGLSPKIPICVAPYLGENVFHSEDFLTAIKNHKDKRIVVVGGGQSAAEIIHYLIKNNVDLPEKLTWVTRRHQILPLDESAFVHEFFTPPYVAHFNALTLAERLEALECQKLASDGISSHLIQAIYQRLYLLECLENKKRFFNFALDSELTRVISHPDKSYELAVANPHDKAEQIISADIIILCTGYEWRLPSCLATLSKRIFFENGRLLINPDFSLVWDGPKNNKIYVQNAARHTHGVADPNLCLMAWRSGKIINSIAGKSIFDLDNESTAIEWRNNNTTFKDLHYVSSRC